MIDKMKYMCYNKASNFKLGVLYMANRAGKFISNLSGNLEYKSFKPNPSKLASATDLAFLWMKRWWKLW